MLSTVTYTLSGLRGIKLSEEITLINTTTVNWSRVIRNTHCAWYELNYPPMCCAYPVPTFNLEMKHLTVTRKLYFKCVITWRPPLTIGPHKTHLLLYHNVYFLIIQTDSIKQNCYRPFVKTMKLKLIYIFLLPFTRQCFPSLFSFSSCFHSPAVPQPCWLFSPLSLLALWPSSLALAPDNLTHWATDWPTHNAPDPHSPTQCAHRPYTFPSL